MYVNSPTDSTDAFGGLSMSLSYSNLLDSFLSRGLTSGYSVSRKLVSSPTGNAFRVRRSSDNAEQDIGFDGDLVDTTSLLSFVGANDGFVETVYDQIGSDDYTQTTTTLQHRIVNAGSLELINTRVRLFNSTLTNNSYILSKNYGDNFTFFFTAGDVTDGFVHIARSIVSPINQCSVANSGNNFRFQIDDGTVQNTSITFNNNELDSYSVRYNQGTLIAHQNNIEITNLSINNGSYNTSEGLRLGDGSYLTEFLVFDRFISEADRFELNKNIDTFYGI